MRMTWAALPAASEIVGDCAAHRHLDYWTVSMTVTLENYGKLAFLIQDALGMTSFSAVKVLTWMGLFY